jgi:Tripartite tricarboxylate transporter family receptor
MRLPRRQFLRLAAGAAVAPAVSQTARAQTYPSRPITMIVPFPAGGNTDAIGRVVAERMRRLLGQAVIIENVSGADGSIGVGRAARWPSSHRASSMPPSTADCRTGSASPACSKRRSHGRASIRCWGSPEFFEQCAHRRPSPEVEVGSVAAGVPPAMRQALRDCHLRLAVPAKKPRTECCCIPSPS